MIHVSQHAISRSQKRAVPPIVFDWLEQFGEEQFDGHGGVVKYFSHDSRRRMERYLGRKFVAENKKYLDQYLVESATDGTIITTGVRFKRIHRRQPRIVKPGKVVFVGDAAMSPYEVMAAGGSVEHFNEEPGAAWMERVTRTYPACVWLNPVPEREWGYTQSIGLVRQLMGNRMFPLTLDGLDRTMRELVR